MKVIQTEYKGTIYRSRTEARWAVFMSVLNFPFIYEPEGFDLGKDGWYIPDFYLPSMDTFMEIKPEIIIPGRESPIEALCRSTKKNVIQFKGMPVIPSFGMELSQILFYRPETDGGIGEDFDYWFCRCPHCGKIGIEYDGRADRIKCKCPKSEHGDKGYNYDDEILKNAYYEARNSFRFSRSDQNYYLKLKDNGKIDFEYEFEKVINKVDPTTQNGRIALVERTAFILQNVKNKIIIESVCQEVAHITELAPYTVNSEVQRLIRKMNKGLWNYENSPYCIDNIKESEISTNELKEKSKLSNKQYKCPPEREFWLLKLLINIGYQFPKVFEIINLEWITHETARMAINEVIQSYKEEKWEGAGDLLNKIENPDIEKLLAAALVDSREIPNIEKQLPDVLTYLRNQWLIKQINKLCEHMDNPDCSMEEILEAMNQRQALEKMRRQPINLEIENELLLCNK